MTYCAAHYRAAKSLGLHLDCFVRPSECPEGIPTLIVYRRGNSREFPEVWQGFPVVNREMMPMFSFQDDEENEDE